MRESERKRLEELILEFERTCPETCTGLEKSCAQCVLEQKIDHLLDNGVVVPPCKVGDIIYAPKHGSNEIIECEVTQVRVIFSKHKGRTIQIYFNSGNKLTEAFFTPIDFKYGFACFTREEAEAKLGGEDK